MPSRLTAWLLMPLALSVVTPAAAWNIAPHRAVYEVELLSIRSRSPIGDVEGLMSFRWADACSGWTVEQSYWIRFLYSSGDDRDITSNYATWETYAGDEMAFSLRSTADGEVDKEIRGQAQANDDGGSVSYRLPDAADHALPVGTMFPTEHTLAVLDHAEAGEAFFNALLFDGTEVNELTEVTAVIGPRRDADADLDDPLLARPSWPVRLAFHPVASDQATPEYEMSVQLYDNGVIDSMDIDYGDFVIRARLRELEPLPDDGC